MTESHWTPIRVTLGSGSNAPGAVCVSADGCQGEEQPSSFLTGSRRSGLTSPVPDVEKRRREGRVLTGENNTSRPPPTQPRLEGRCPAPSPGHLPSRAPLNSGTVHSPPARPQNNSLPAHVTESCGVLQAPCFFLKASDSYKGTEMY